MARIRTIKPEFWQNESLAKVSLHAKLLAIALLNHADDEGFFLANAALVRAACFPFDDDSKNVLGSLQELSRIGYIEVRECGDKTVGVVCKFAAHQRIDKPQKSKLKTIFAEEFIDSRNIPGTFQESSENAPRRNREQGTGKGKEQGEEVETKLSLSPEIESFRKSPEWKAWKRHRNEKLKPLGEIEEDYQLHDLQRFSLSEAARIVAFTMERGAVNLITNGDHKKPKRTTANAGGIAW